MLTRRRFLGYSALAPAALAYRPLLHTAASQGPGSATGRPLRLAVLGNTYRLGSELQSIADRFLVGYPFKGEWHMPNIQVVSLYMEPKPHPEGYIEPRPRPDGSPDVPAAKQSAQTVQRSHEEQRPDVAQSVQRAALREASPLVAEEKAGPLADLSARRSREFGFRVCASIPEALRCGGDDLAVDAVLAVVEAADYPRNDFDQILSPRYDFFEQCVQVFEAEGRSVPYFNHEALSYSFREAMNMVATAERLKFPLMAGSALPVTWRLPDVDIPFGARIQEAVMVGSGSFDGTDFDALEAMQCMMERRKDGESGVKAVQLLRGDEVWEAGDSGRWSKELLSSALSRSDAPLGLTLLDGRTQDMVASGVLPQIAKDPAAYCIEYNDGTRATLLMLNGAERDFTFSARVDDHGLIATQFFRSPSPNRTRTAALAAKIEHMFVNGTAPYPVHRTLLTSGMLEACLISKARMNQRMETPHLAVHYEAPAESQFART